LKSGGLDLPAGGIPSVTMDKQHPAPDKELLLRVKTIMVLRIVLLTGFVALIIAFERTASYRTPIVPLSIVIATAYTFSIAYALILRWSGNLNLVAWMQILGDTLVVGGMIYATGGIESPLSFLYLFVTIAAGIMLPRMACYLAASAASIVYGLLVDLEYFNIIDPIYFFPKSSNSYLGVYGFYTIAMNIASFFSVAFLTSILSTRVRVIKEELQMKSQDLITLQEFHRNVLQNMVSGLITTDLQGRITSVNDACVTITGFQLDEFLGRSLLERMPLKTLKSFFEKGASDLPLHIEGEFPKKDGEMILVSMKISCLTRPENVSETIEGYIFVIDDLTEIRKMEEKVMQSEQLAAVGKFSAGLAHEIRNPLASLSGSIQVLRQAGNLEGDYRHLMDIMIQETERLNSIVNDFLAYSQPRKNKSTVIDLTQLLEDIIMLMKNSNEYDPSIKIQLEVPPDHILIQSDEKQIKQMIWNLSVNAIQSMKREGQLILSAENVNGFEHKDFSTHRKGVLITIQDEGRGIPPDKLQSVFEPFFTTRDEGVGLGLPTVSQIVKRFGGHIHVESEIDQGTTFHVFLPQERSLSRGAEALDRSSKETHEIAGN